MADVYNEFYIHLVWATAERAPLLNDERKTMITAEIYQKARELRSFVIAVNTMPDHVHVLVHMAVTCSVASLVQHLKGASSRRVNREQPTAVFRWQGGYGAFTVSPWEVDRVVAYIRDQQRHHAHGTLEPELECL